MFNFLKEFFLKNNDPCSLIEQIEAVDLAGKTVIVTIKANAHPDLREKLHTMLPEAFPNTKIWVVEDMSIIIL